MTEQEKAEKTLRLFNHALGMTGCGEAKLIPVAVRDWDGPPVETSYRVSVELRTAALLSSVISTLQGCAEKSSAIFHPLKTIKFGENTAMSCGSVAVVLRDRPFTEADAEKLEAHVAKERDRPTPLKPLLDWPRGESLQLTVSKAWFAMQDNATKQAEFAVAKRMGGQYLALVKALRGPNPVQAKVLTAVIAVSSWARQLGLNPDGIPDRPPDDKPGPEGGAQGDACPPDCKELGDSEGTRICKWFGSYLGSPRKRSVDCVAEFTREEKKNG